MASRFGWSFSVTDCNIEPEELVAIFGDIRLKGWKEISNDRPINTERGELLVQVFESESADILRLTVVHESSRAAGQVYFCSLGGHLVGGDQPSGNKAARIASHVYALVSKIAANQVSEFELDCDAPKSFCQQFRESFEAVE